MEATPTSEIILRPLEHRGSKWIGLFFAYNIQTIARVREIPGSRYSRSHRCWYVPYTPESYHNIKESQLNYKIETPAETAVATRHYPLSSDKAIIEDHDRSSNPSEMANEVRKPSSDINPGYPGLNKIIWQGGKFYIKIDYSSVEVSYLKSLAGAYWNQAKKYWVCRGDKENLRQLQNRYRYWDENTLSDLSDLTIKYAPKTNVLIRAVIGDESLMEVKIRMAEEVLLYIKTMSNRRFDKEKRVWLLPKDKSIRDELYSIAQKANHAFIDKITWQAEEPITRTNDRRRQILSLLKNISEEERKEYLPYLEAFGRCNFGYNTMKSYFSSFRRFIQEYGSVEKVSKLTIDEIEKYLRKIVRQNVAYQELNRHISAIKFYYKHVEKWSEIRLRRIDRPKRAHTLPDILSMKEIERLLAQIENKKHLCMIYFAYGCGLRSGEILHLKVEHIKLDRKQVLVKSGKGKKDRVVYLPDTLMALLQNYLHTYRPDYWLFPGQKKGHAYSSSSLRAIFKRACKRAGLPPGLKLHGLRHSYATHLMEEGTQMRIIQKLLGHQSIKTTEIYTHVSNFSMDKIVSPLDRLMQKRAKNDDKEL